MDDQTYKQYREQQEIGHRYRIEYESAQGQAQARLIEAQGRAAHARLLGEAELIKTRAAHHDTEMALQRIRMWRSITLLVFGSCCIALLILLWRAYV